MEISEILQELETDKGRLPREALRAAIDRREAITPELLRMLDDAAARMAELGAEPDSGGYTYAMYLLAQFRETRAHPPIVRFFSTPGEVSVDVTGDVVTQDLDRILASTCGGDSEPIERLIEDAQVNEWVRNAGIRSMVNLVIAGQRSREEVIAYYRELFEGRLGDASDTVWSGLACCSTDLYPEELHSHIERAYRDGLVDPGVMGFEDVTVALERDKEAVLAELPRHHRGLIDDAIGAMGWWHWPDKERQADVLPDSETEDEDVPDTLWPAVDDRSTPDRVKIGRNEPCPCGSGKKYKRCCGRRA